MSMSWSGYDFPLLVNLVLVVCSFVVVLAHFSLKKKGLPPGPRGWPFVGYIRFILDDKPAELLQKVKEKYGDIFGFHVGSRYCVVLSDYASMKEAFSKKTFQNRPPSYLRTSVQHKNFSELDYAEWDMHRKFFTNTLRQLGVGRSRFEEIVQNELSRVIPKFELYVNKRSCNIREVVSTSINNTVLQIICSRWFEEDHPFMRCFLEFQKLSAESFSNNMAFIYFPWMDWFLCRFNPQYRAIWTSLNNMSEFVSSEIRKREKIHNENSEEDYIDLYLTEMKTRQENDDVFNVGNLVANCTLLFMAGSDTTRNTLEWLIMAMAQFPDIQQKVYNEIISVIGAEKQPAYEDRTNLPFTEATIMESERWKTLAPLNVLRWTTEDTVIQGYNIPKNTVIIHNLRYCHRDPKHWKSPEEFIPERFLSNDKTRVVVPESFLPFSMGKRDCPGDKVASIEIFLYFTSIMQKYKILAPKDGLCLEEEHRVNMQALKPLVRVMHR